jgi:hypothetical protein
LRDCDDTEVLTELASAGVTHVKHILTKRDGNLEPTNTFILTFDRPTLPTHITVGYLRVPVELFIPNPHCVVSVVSDMVTEDLIVKDPRFVLDVDRRVTMIRIVLIHSDVPIALAIIPLTLDNVPNGKCRTRSQK